MSDKDSFSGFFANLATYFQFALVSILYKFG